MLLIPDPPLEPGLVQSAPAEHRATVEKYQAAVLRVLEGLAQEPRGAWGEDGGAKAFLGLLALTCPFNPFTSRRMALEASKVLLERVLPPCEHGDAAEEHRHMESSRNDLFPPEFLRPLAYLSVPESSHDARSADGVAQSALQGVSKALLVHRAGCFLELQAAASGRHVSLWTELEEELQSLKEPHINARFSLVQLVLLMKEPTVAKRHAVLLRHLIELFEDHEPVNKSLGLIGITRMLTCVGTEALLKNGLLHALFEGMKAQTGQRHALLISTLYPAMYAALLVLCPAPEASSVETTEWDTVFAKLIRDSLGEQHLGLRRAYVQNILLFAKKLGNLCIRHFKTLIPALKYYVQAADQESADTGLVLLLVLLERCSVRLAAYKADLVRYLSTVQGELTLAQDRGQPLAHVTELVAKCMEALRQL